MKAILISIKPKYVAKILNGEKTIEIRKTCPEIFKHLKPYEGCSIDVYIYCTKDKKVDTILYRPYKSLECSYRIQGKVVAKFTLNKVEEIMIAKTIGVPVRFTRTLPEKDLCIATCLTPYDFNDYLKNKLGYAWHISNLEIFDIPKELSEFFGAKQYFVGCESGIDKTPRYARLTKAPQSWCYVEVE